MNAILPLADEIDRLREELAKLKAANIELAATLQSIIDEVSDYPPAPPFSSDSFLPGQFINRAKAVLAKFSLSAEAK